MNTHAANEIGFSFDELSQVALNGFESAFVHHDQRKTLIAEAQREIAELKRSIT